MKDFLSHCSTIHYLSYFKPPHMSKDNWSLEQAWADSFFLNLYLLLAAQGLSCDT